MKNLYLFIATVLFSSILSAQKVSILTNLKPDDGDGFKISSQIVTFNGKTYFSGSNANSDYYLYETSGTESSTKRVSSAKITYVKILTVSGNLMYFSGYDVNTSTDAIYTLNTSGVIAQVKAISNIIHLVPFGVNGAIFIQEDPVTGKFPLWKTDGTAATNLLLGSFNFNSSKAYFSTFNNSVIIAEQSTNFTKFEPIITDGTVVGTKKLKDFLAPAKVFEKIESVTSIKDKIFIEGTVKDPNNGLPYNKKFITDGTPLGTSEIYELNFKLAYELNNTIFVLTNLGVFYWDNAKKTLQYIASKGFFDKPIENNGRIFFHDSDNYVWVADATTKKAKKISTESAGKSNYDPVLFAKGDSLFYTTQNSNGEEWRAINLKNNKDSLFTNFRIYNSTTVNPTMAILGNQLIFSRITDAEGSELWTYGTSSYVAPLMTKAKIVTPIQCNAGKAELGVSILGGVAPYTYKWSDSKLVGDKPLATANNYSVTVTDAKGTASVSSINVTQPSAITVTTTGKPTTPAQKNGTATANASGGNPSYKYLWNTTPAQTTAIATGLDKATYIVTVTDANLCTATATVSVGSTATNEVWQKYKFEIYPNPASEWLNIKFENIENIPTSVSIIDMNGKIIQEQVLDNNSKSINISAIPQGIYLLKCKLGTNEMATSTIFIQR